MSICRGPECDKQVQVKKFDLCGGHYAQHRQSRPLAPLLKHAPRNATVAQLIDAMAERDPDTGCLRWTGTHDEDGYARVKRGGMNRSVHRLVWIDANGEVPEGLVVDHKCHTRDCVDVKHLRLLTNALNLQNRKGAHKNSATGVRGVFPTPAGTYRTRVKVGGKFIGGGTFKTIEEAEGRAIELRMEHFTHTDGR